MLLMEPRFNNCLLDDSSDEVDEVTDGEENMVHEQAPDLGFTNIDQINDATVDVLMPGKEQTKKDDGELYVGQRFTTKDKMQSAVNLYSLRVHRQYQLQIQHLVCG